MLEASPDAPRNENTIEELRRSASLYDIFPTSGTESADSVLQYVLWLRSERGILPNYEANMWVISFLPCKYISIAHTMTN